MQWCALFTLTVKLTPRRVCVVLVWLVVMGWPSLNHQFPQHFTIMPHSNDPSCTYVLPSSLHLSLWCSFNIPLLPKLLSLKQNTTTKCSSPLNILYKEVSTDLLSVCRELKIMWKTNYYLCQDSRRYTSFHTTLRLYLPLRSACVRGFLVHRHPILITPNTCIDRLGASVQVDLRFRRIDLRGSKRVDL